MYDLTKEEDIDRMIADGFEEIILGDSMFSKQKNILLLANMSMKLIFGYNISQIGLEVYEDTQDFMNKKNKLPSGRAYYDHVNQVAHVIYMYFGNDKFFIPTIFHELYGHGIFFQKTEYGRKIDESKFFEKHNEAKLTEKEKQVATKLKAQYGVHGDYDGKLSSWNQIKVDVEGVAFWIEMILTRLAINYEYWDKRYSDITNNYLTEVQHQFAHHKYFVSGKEMSFPELKEITGFD